MLALKGEGSKTAQGYEIQLGANCLGKFIFTGLSCLVLVRTANITPPNFVRVSWVTSNGAEKLTPLTGIDVSDLHYHVDKSAMRNYCMGNANNIFHAIDFVKKSNDRVKGSSASQLVPCAYEQIESKFCHSTRGHVDVVISQAAGIRCAEDVYGVVR